MEVSVRLYFLSFSEFTLAHEKTANEAASARASTDKVSNHSYM